MPAVAGEAGQPCRAPERPPTIVTTTSEFHSLRRQLTRLAEDGVPVEWVDAHPREGLADRILEALVPGTALLAMSAVLFDDAHVVPRLGEIAERALSVGALVLVDAYHAFNVVPLEWGPAQGRLHVTAGGYKYAGFGEGLCWLRIPPGSTLRTVYTGWFADFGALSVAGDGRVAYGPGGARFSGATFDASAIYRAHAVLGHWERFGLGPEQLRAVSTRQTRRILDRLDALGHGAAVLSSRDDARRGGFVAVRAGARADTIVQALRGEGVLIDARNGVLRLGPAPYLTDEEIDRGVDAAARALGSGGEGPPAAWRQAAWLESSITSATDAARMARSSQRSSCAGSFSARMRSRSVSDTAMPRTRSTVSTALTRAVASPIFRASVNVPCSIATISSSSGVRLGLAPSMRSRSTKSPSTRPRSIASLGSAARSASAFGREQARRHQSDEEGRTVLRPLARHYDPDAVEVVAVEVDARRKRGPGPHPELA